MIRHMFVFGVLLPTLVTVFLFVAFLLCWFKFNMRERFFKKRKLFSKQLKHAMAPQRRSLSKSDIAPTSGGSGKGDCAGGSGKDGGSSGGGGGVGAMCGVLSRKQNRYENCPGVSSRSEGVDDTGDHHSVGDDPEAALCAACEDEATHAQSLSGFSNPNLCVSPTHSATADDEAEDDDEETGTGSPRRGTGNGDAHAQEEEEGAGLEHSDPEDHIDAEMEYVQVKKVGSMFQHTFHFPASECSHISNSLVVDSEDGGSEDGSSNYGHFVPLAQLLRDPKARQLYNARSSSLADDPVAGLTRSGDVGSTVGVSCTDGVSLIQGM